VQLWVGLGNPGVAYALHRHNVGFMALDAIAATYDFSPWRKQFQGLAADGRIGTEKLLLLKPTTFMNESGRAVRAACDFYRLAPEAVTAFHDELDLIPMKVKVKSGGGAAGHNGLRSMIAHIGPDFRRVRIGIGHPGHKDKVTPYVLGPYAKNEQNALADMLGALAAEAGWLAANDSTRFMNDIALRLSA
jgi:peptidyl-tRNA hydrolase, PTH1 family